ncbi:MAG: 3-methyladenine DNA glycosylase [Wolinella sp.]
MRIENSFELLAFLKSQGYLKNPPHELWWPNGGSFEVIVGAILVQNSHWESVERALGRLKESELLCPNALANIDTIKLAELIKDVGLYKTKATRLRLFCEHLTASFGDFENFCENVSREWLLKQKGIGPESCDSILCYACLRDEMVASRYAYKLLCSFGYELAEYVELKEWLEAGIYAHLDEIHELYGYAIPLHKIFARFHGKIVEYGKNHNKK